MSQCQRCGKDFAPSELAAPSAMLRTLSAPVLLLFFGGSRQVRHETLNLHLYCRPCRRSLNAVYLFIAFAVVTGGICAFVQWLGKP